MKKLFLILAGILLGTSLAIAWTGSDPCSYITRLGTGTTSATLDGETVSIPASVFVNVRNTLQGIDITKLYLIEDTNSDSVIQQSELDNIKMIKDRPDMNFPEIDNIQFGPRYLLDSSLIKEGNSYFLILPSKDLNGDTNTDTSTLADCSYDGDATHSDTDVRQFFGGQARP